MIGPQQWRLAGLQVALAATVVVGARWLQSSIQPPPDGASAFEILFDPTFWSSFATFVVTHLMIAAATGWVVGVGLALAVLAIVPAVRERWLIVLLAVPATGAALSLVRALLVA